MSKAFQKGKARQAKINGQWIFGDFSEGLYLLDTPRSITEQLGSLALVGGVNTFCEKGALIPQYGYVEKSKINNEYIVAISKDVESGYLFLLANTGNVFLYTPNEGLKKFKTTLEEVSESALMTCRQDELIISDNGKNILFGKNYGTDATKSTVLATDIPISTFGYFSDIQIPVTLKDNFWLGKEVDVNEIGKAVVTSIQEGTKIKVPIPPTYEMIASSTNCMIEGDVKLSKSNSTIDLGSGNTIALGYDTTKTTQTITEYTTEVTQYEYQNMPIQKNIPDTEVGKYNIPVQTYHVRPTEGNLQFDINKKVGDLVYIRFEYKGIAEKNWSVASRYFKVYRISNDSLTLRDTATKGLVVPEFTINKIGEISTTVEHIRTVESGVDYPTITFNIGGQTLKLPQGNDNYAFGDYVYQIKKLDNVVSIVLLKNNSTIIDTITSMSLSGTGEIGGDVRYYENGERASYEEISSLTIRVSHKDSAAISVSPTTTISEKAYMEIEWTYTPEEDSPEEPRILNPKLIAWSCNRLFVEDMEGAIYYSTVGSADNFNEDMGAGYFQGFYGDNSELLSIEEFLGKVLLTKKNGMYTLVIGQTNSSYSTAAGTSFDTSGITIEKIAEIGQEYPNDHVIVREAIYAYDTNSASIVQAASQNVFGSIVAGTTLVSADYLSAQNFGIIDRKRCLTYNSEAQVFVLYYGEDLTDGIVLTSQGSLFPRKLDRGVEYFIGFNQGVLGIMSDGTIFQDFKRNTVVPSVKPVAEFEAIGVKDNRLLMGSILEVTELNGVEYDISVTNTDTSFQHIQPYTNYGIDGLNIPPLIYSDARDKYPSFELETKWAVKKSNLTRVYAPMSGREGVSIAFTFPANVSFCLAALRIPDLSQGE